VRPVSRAPTHLLRGGGWSLAVLASAAPARWRSTRMRRSCGSCSSGGQSSSPTGRPRGRPQRARPRRCGWLRRGRKGGVRNVYGARAALLRTAQALHRHGKRGLYWTRMYPRCSVDGRGGIQRGAEMQHSNGRLKPATSKRQARASATCDADGPGPRLGSQPAERATGPGAPFGSVAALFRIAHTTLGRVLVQ
jgi:hypothetical protein